MTLSGPKNQSILLRIAPTIMLDGVEYQQERRGPSGFY
jgi:hypothetical protein